MGKLSQTGLGVKSRETHCRSRRRRPLPPGTPAHHPEAAGLPSSGDLGVSRRQAETRGIHPGVPGSRGSGRARHRVGRGRTAGKNRVRVPGKDRLPEFLQVPLRRRQAEGAGVPAIQMGDSRRAWELPFPSCERTPHEKAPVWRLTRETRPTIEIHEGDPRRARRERVIHEGAVARISQWRPMHALANCLF